MAAAKPMLDHVPLDQVQIIEGDQNEVFLQHQVPALEGDFFEDAKRRATRVKVHGILTGAGAAKGIETLRAKFRSATAVPFVADISTATKVSQVLIEEMSLRELAGKPNRFEYGMTLVEFIPSGGSSAKSPSNPPAPPPQTPARSNLSAHVTVDGSSSFAFPNSVATLEGVSTSGNQMFRILSNRSGNTWFEQDVPPGSYTVKVVLTSPPRAASRHISLSAGNTKTIALDLKPVVAIARAFVVHFASGKSFVEPDMLGVLRLAVEYANSHPDEKLMIVGHSDAVGAAPANQVLSEERARNVLACLTYGRSPAFALAQWNAARESSQKIPHARWGLREYQLMLQDLGYFQGEMGRDLDLTQAAVRDFQLDRGLSGRAAMDADAWSVLIDAYLHQDSFAVSESRFVDRPTLGVAGRRPVKNTRYSWRPNRRCELLFVSPKTRPYGYQNAVIIPPEVGEVTVRGCIRFDDGSPVPNLKFAMTAPDGECMDGERATGSDRGSPIPGCTDAQGMIFYPGRHKIPGLYTIEVEGRFLARLAGEPLSAAKGARVTKRLNASSSFDIWLCRR